MKQTPQHGATTKYVPRFMLNYLAEAKAYCDEKRIRRELDNDLIEPFAESIHQNSNRYITAQDKIDVGEWALL